jgi:hypothetical protein
MIGMHAHPLTPSTSQNPIGQAVQLAITQGLLLLVPSQLQDTRRVRPYAIRWLEVLQQLWQTAPMSILRHAKSWKELLPQLWHSSEALDSR